MFGPISKSPPNRLASRRERIARCKAMLTLEARANGLKLAYRSDGPPSGAPMVLIHGLGQTLVDWPSAFIDKLADAGCRVLRLDNRDVGRSWRMDHLGAPPLLRLWASATLRLPPLARPPYSLADMTADVVGLLDALGVPAVHLVGASMGGMIAQRVAIAHPERVLSLTSIMSSSGAPGLPSPRKEVRAELTREAAPNDPAAAVEKAKRFRRLIGGTLRDGDLAELERRVEQSVAYGWPESDGAARQYAAILADRGRHHLLSQIRSRCLVVHGGQDRFVPPAHGEDTAARIAGSRLVAIGDMGHEITLSSGQIVADEILAHVRAGGGRQ